VTAQYERTLQTEIMWRANRLPIKVAPIPNGIWIPTRDGGEIECPHCHAVFDAPDQKQLVARIINRLKTDGMLVPGLPDLATIWAGGGGFLELKRPATKDLFGVRVPAGRPTPEQKLFAEDCHRLGINHAFCSTWEDVRSNLQTWGAIK
jgi:hypothetical protein